MSWQGPTHPYVRKRMHEIYNRLGFANLDEWDEFWKKINAISGRYECPSEEELVFRKGLIIRAQGGERIDVRRIYEGEPGLSAAPTEESSPSEPESPVGASSSANAELS